ncbi:DMT family transporter [Paenibacillus ehimensis]|uniref:DMT family transporter n=1 Tax=Paenibacillus ehimensis TaxID=79264 RepID=A0ABT8V2C4_9BACL|nr:DMT family transporter [Paenibacillus ehimensis]MDO3675569.1 DMT family transporter [Paenibacillus ehimensis]MEC0209569.1 DMT family transporter [Paenibacillus ehimensis]
MNPIYYGLLVLATTSLMGSSFAIGKMGMAYFSPLLLVGCRFTIAGLLMVLWIMRRPFPQTARHWTKLFLIGLFQTAGVMGCIFLSLRTITAGESSILTFLNPLLVVLLGTLFLGIRYRFSQWLGVIFGFIGVYVTLGFHLQWQVGTILGLGAALCWSIGTVLIKKWGAAFHLRVLTAFQMLFGGLVLLGMSVTLETPKLIVTPASVFILLWLAVMASIVQFAVWFYLLEKGDPGKTSAFLFLAPFFGVLSGWLLLDEVIKWYVYAGGVLIFLGIFLANWSPAGRKLRTGQTNVSRIFDTKKHPHPYRNPPEG